MVGRVVAVGRVESVWRAEGVLDMFGRTGGKRERRPVNG